MTVKDLSFWGLVKLSLILDVLIPILFMPIVLIIAIFAPEKITWSDKFNISGVTVDATSGDVSVTLVLLSGLLIGFIGLMIQCAILHFLAQKTPLGRVKIGPNVT